MLLTAKLDDVSIVKTGPYPSCKYRLIIHDDATAEKIREEFIKALAEADVENKLESVLLPFGDCREMYEKTGSPLYRDSFYLTTHFETLPEFARKDGSDCTEAEQLNLVPGQTVEALVSFKFHNFGNDFGAGVSCVVHAIRLTEKAKYDFGALFEDDADPFAEADMPGPKQRTPKNPKTGGRHKTHRRRR